MSRYVFVCTLMFLALPAYAGQVVTLSTLTAQGTGPAIGSIFLEDTPHGLLLTPDLTGLPPGLHGFHVHQNGSCAPAEKNGMMVPGLAAGGHYDPTGTGDHLGPYGTGHLGDLPSLYVTPAGTATLPLLAPRLTLKNVRGHALIIHAGEDNFRDTPAPLGGGGARIACGVVK